MSVLERKHGGGPSGTRAQSEVKRAEIIKLRLAGRTLDDVAQAVGLTREGCRYHEQAWLAEQTPSAEVTEERRQKQLASIDSVKSRLFASLDSEDELAVRLAVVDRIAKLWDREARLAGLDLERNVIAINVTREALAASLGWAPPADAIDVEATEEPA